MKAIFIRMLNLVRSSQKEWSCIAVDSPSVDLVGRNFFFPFLLVMAIALALTCIIELTVADFDSFSQFLGFVAVRFLVVLSSLFASVYGSALIMHGLLKIRFFRVEERAFYKCFSLFVYSSSIMWITFMLSMMIPSLFFLKVAVFLFEFYVIWCGLTVYYPTMKDNVKGVLMFVDVVLMFISPMLMVKIMEFLMN
ncbi:MAG: hypothetical protein IK017_00730 [Paludibacteraceae bacterium]|nr:hypothetical protein [Paludibacteraceae bacterium]